MVRLKSRYILFELLYLPESVSDEHAGTDFHSKKEIILRHHLPSPSSINAKLILQEIRRSLQLNFGDYGAGKGNSLLHLKYFSNMTSTGILRCHREDCDLVVSALMLLNKIGDREGVVLNTVKVSGTIKKIEEYVIRRNRNLGAIMNKKYTDTDTELTTTGIDTDFNED